MKSTVKFCIFATAFAAITCVGAVDEAEAGNGWGWAKPMNQKPGSMLYTTNRRFRGQTASRPTTSYSFNPLRTSTQVKSIAPSSYSQVTVQSPAVIMNATPTTQVPSQPVLDSGIIHSQAPLVEPPVKAPSMLDGWLVP